MSSIQLSFSLRVSSGVKTVHLMGSWDNYDGQLPLARDKTSSKSGAWKGTFRFQNSTLEPGQRYWYYYIIDGYHTSHNPSEPSTVEPTTGRELNVLDVPRSSKSSSSGGGHPLQAAVVVGQQDLVVVPPQLVQPQLVQGPPVPPAAPPGHPQGPPAVRVPDQGAQADVAPCHTPHPGPRLRPGRPGRPLRRHGYGRVRVRRRRHHRVQQQQRQQQQLAPVVVGLRPAILPLRQLQPRLQRLRLLDAQLGLQLVHPASATASPARASVCASTAAAPAAATTRTARPRPTTTPAATRRAPPAGMASSCASDHDGRTPKRPVGEKMEHPSFSPLGSHLCLFLRLAPVPETARTHAPPLNGRKRKKTHQNDVHSFELAEPAQARARSKEPVAIASFAEAGPRRLKPCPSRPPAHLLHRGAPGPVLGPCRSWIRDRGLAPRPEGGGHGMGTAGFAEPRHLGRCCGPTIPDMVV